MARTKKKQQQVIKQQKPILWHVITNDIPYDLQLFSNIKGPRNTTAYKIGQNSTLKYDETEIVTTSFVNNTIVALGDYKLDDNNMMNCRSFGLLPNNLITQFFDQNTSKTLVVSEEINNFVTLMNKGNSGKQNSLTIIFVIFVCLFHLVP